MVRKLFRLREWLTIDEAASHLANVLGEEVTKADVFRLSLDGHLTLSVDLVNHARAHLGRVVPFKDVPMLEMPALDDENRIVQMPQGHLIDRVSEIAEDTRFVCFDSEVVSIKGVWDLTMLGGDRIEISDMFYGLVGGPPVELVSLEGTFVSHPDGRWAQLLEQLPEDPPEKRLGIPKKQPAYYPPSGLPADSILVVRTSALTAFQARLAEPSPLVAADDRQMGTRERDTLLKLVVGMAVEAYRYDPNAARSAIPAEIASDLAKHGVAVTDDTVRKYLKEAAATVLPACVRR